jgi:hypothetical protein
MRTTEPLSFDRLYSVAANFALLSKHDHANAPSGVSAVGDTTLQFQGTADTDRGKR